jgi:decaprenylphospho-beta-D-ribofuranose 2-oxidase
LALDLPIRPDSSEIVRQLNEVVIRYGGRIYLTKDGFSRAEDYAAMEPRIGEFLRVRDEYDPEGRLRSAQSLRLFGR